jgi:hypothetical protein
MLIGDVPSFLFVVWSKHFTFFILLNFLCGSGATGGAGWGRPECSLLLFLLVLSIMRRIRQRVFQLLNAMFQRDPYLPLALLRWERNPSRTCLRFGDIPVCLLRVRRRRIQWNQSVFCDAPYESRPWEKFFVFVFKPFKHSLSSVRPFCELLWWRPKLDLWSFVDFTIVFVTWGMSYFESMFEVCWRC